MRQNMLHITDVIRKPVILNLKDPQSTTFHEKIILMIITITVGGNISTEKSKTNEISNIMILIFCILHRFLFQII